MSIHTLRFPCIALFLLATFSLLSAASRNISPDALSRTTTFNTYEGELAALQDGKYPPQEAAPFFWHTKGILAFEWGESLPLEKVRIYVGEIGNNFQVRAYSGGYLDPTGALREPEGELTALVEENSRVTDQWVELQFPPGTAADNLELRALGSAIFYEVEIYIRTEDTAVEPLGWGQVKARLR